jgi:hypothetical protein
MIAEVLRRAEAEGLWEKAVAEVEEHERKREEEARQAKLAAIHATLDELIKHEDQSISQRSLMLKHAGDDQLLHIVRKLRGG